jgi:hypothetical protein
MDHRIQNRYFASKENELRDIAPNWLELEFYTKSQTLAGQISCPAGLRILDMLNTPYSASQKAKVEFIYLEDYLKPDHDEPRTVFVKKDDILFVSAPDVNMGRGLGAKGEFKVYPFVPKKALRVSIQVNTYLITANLFHTNDQTMLDVLNDEMFFLPLTDVSIAKDYHYYGDRPFIAVNKGQIDECREEARS